MCQGTKASRKQKIQIQIWRAALKGEEREREGESWGGKAIYISGDDELPPATVIIWAIPKILARQRTKRV